MESERGESNLPKSVTTEEATANPLVQQLVGPRIVKVRALAEYFLETIISSLNTVPYGIRWICKQIRVLTKVHFLCFRLHFKKKIKKKIQILAKIP